MHCRCRSLAHPLWLGPGGVSGTSPTGSVTWLGRFSSVRRPVPSNSLVPPKRYRPQSRSALTSILVPTPGLESTCKLAPSISARSPSKPRDAALGVDSLVLSFRTMFDPHAAQGIEASYEFRLGEDVFWAVVEDGRFEIARGSTDRPDAMIETDAGTLAALIYEGRDLAEALRSGDARIEGDESAVERFVTLFPLPEPAAPAGEAGS